MIKELQDINFVSMLKMLEEMNAGYVHVGINDYHFITCTEEAFRVMEKAYDEWVDQEEGEKAGGWILCSKRLPEDGQSVIFTSLDDNGEPFSEVGYYSEYENLCINQSYFPSGFEFIAWMPLPEPFKAGDQE